MATEPGTTSGDRSLHGDPSDTAEGVPVLEMRGIGKSFPGVVALRDISLVARAGEVVALLGENAAGKSTLINVLSRVPAR